MGQFEYQYPELKEGITRFYNANWHAYCWVLIQNSLLSVPKYCFDVYFSNPESALYAHHGYSAEEVALRKFLDAS